MEWVNIHSSVLASPEFVLASDTERGTWLCLLAFCCTQENSGRISGAKKWPTAAWPQMCRVSAKIVLRTSSLWSWEGDDLVVNGYSVAKEQHVKQARGIALAGAMKRWGKAERDAERHSGLDAENSIHGNAEGKGREGKKREEEEEGDPASASAPLSLSSEPSSKPDRKSPKNPTPDECPEPLRSRMLAIGALVHRRASTPWKAEELTELRSQRLDAISDEEFEADLTALEGYYGLPLSGDDDFRRRELIRLLRHWPDDVRNALKRAQEWRAKHDPDGLGAAS